MPACWTSTESLFFYVLAYGTVMCIVFVDAGDVHWSTDGWNQQWQVPQMIAPSHWDGGEVYSVEGPFHEHNHLHHHHQAPQYKVRTVTKIVRKVPKTVTHSFTTYEDDDEPWISLHVDRPKHRPKPTVLLNGWAKDGKFGLTLNIH